LQLQATGRGSVLARALVDPLAERLIAELELEADSLIQPSLGIPPGVERPVEAGKPED
jgi:hypothetical protein